MFVTNQWKRSLPDGPALQLVGGSLSRSFSSFWMRFSADAMVLVWLVASWKSKRSVARPISQIAHSLSKKRYAAAIQNDKSTSKVVEAG